MKGNIAMDQNYYSALAGFLNDTKRERILYELQSKKKKEMALSKMTDFSGCFNVKDIAVDLSRLEVKEAVERIEVSNQSKLCFDLVYAEIVPVKDAYIRAVNSYMVDVLIVDENTIIYIGECSYGASEKYILKK